MNKRIKNKYKQATTTTTKIQHKILFDFYVDFRLGGVHLALLRKHQIRLGSFI